MKKSILLVSLASVSAIACSLAFALNNKNMFSTIASGDNRALTIDSDTNFTINDGVGIADLGRNLKAYSPNCERLGNGNLRLNTGKLFIYYNETIGSDLITWRGFNDATISSLVATVYSSNQTIYAGWAYLKADYSEYGYQCSTSKETELTDDEKVITFNDGSFIADQGNAKYSMYYVVSLRSYGNASFDLVSLNLNYTCQ